MIKLSLSALVTLCLVFCLLVTGCKDESKIITKPVVTDTTKIDTTKTDTTKTPTDTTKVPVDTIKVPVPPKINYSGDSVAPQLGPYVIRMVPDIIGKSITGYYEALPSSHAASKRKFPLLIFFSGAGERGDGTVNQLPKVLHGDTPPSKLVNGTFPLYFKSGDLYYSYIVLCVQTRTNRWTLPVDMDSLIAKAIRTYKVDTTRVYITGLSMGGGVVWDYAGAKPAYATRLAAMAPVSGLALDPSTDKAKVMADGNVHTWAFHCDLDKDVPSSISKNYVQWINSYKPGLANITLYPEAQHDSWTRAYAVGNTSCDGKNVYEWMLQFQK